MYHLMIGRPVSLFAGFLSFKINVLQAVLKFRANCIGRMLAEFITVYQQAPPYTTV
jgi:hypothetical protein